VAASGGNLFLAMILVMCGCIILGMGMPTTASYIIAASVMVQAMIEMGLIPIAAHMFCFYFACLSMVTPPVALAAFAAAPIADASTWKTGLTAFTLAVGGFVIPFAFAQNPVLLLQEINVLEFAWVFVTALVGILALSSAVMYLGPKKLGWLFRPLYVVGGLLCVDPAPRSDITGIIVIVCLVTISHFLTKKSRQLKEQL